MRQFQSSISYIWRDLIILQNHNVKNHQVSSQIKQDLLIRVVRWIQQFNVICRGNCMLFPSLGPSNWKYKPFKTKAKLAHIAAFTTYRSCSSHHYTTPQFLHSRKIKEEYSKKAWAQCKGKLYLKTFHILKISN